MEEQAIYRIAAIQDIPGMQQVRNAVKENTLSDPALVPDSDVADYITRRGRGWVALVNGYIAGFSIADLIDNNVWALFVDPRFENRGIGKQLHNLMLGWYFEQTDTPIWLSTSFNTRAARFYELQGWKDIGLHGNERKFEMRKRTG